MWQHGALPTECEVRIIAVYLYDTFHGKGNATSSMEVALERIREMPEETTLDEIAEETLQLAAIRRSRAAAEAGQVMSNEELKKQAAAWITK
jgi:predicted transcriptional regulator